MALEALKHLINDIPEWQYRLDDLASQINRHQAELAAFDAEESNAPIPGPLWLARVSQTHVGSMNVNTDDTAIPAAQADRRPLDDPVTITLYWGPESPNLADSHKHLGEGVSAVIV
ncbi:methyltransferase type 11 [Purpureocillium lavendulum]|uniref:Methyltransferase type 11 n=1 Tax=Purpureocillium lavendulum TaxID=1247861 RepID=A0AB34FLL6_9HYPO|nr:methyltransferase type 11 [Purpureocillium lavendulum]